MKANVNTAEYRASHVKVGRGYGCWVFRPATAEAAAAVARGDYSVCVNASGTYGQAKASLSGGSWVLLP